jgi:hypothetical protein
MGTVTAQYGPESGQDARSSPNFPNWDPPENSWLYWQVTLPPGAGSDMQPTFNVDHDKDGPDTRWYTGVQNGAEFPVSSQNGDPGGHAIYVITTSPIVSGQTYAVTCYWYFPD